MIVCHSHKIIPGAGPDRSAWRQLPDNTLPTLASFYLNND